ncbi:MAG: universal stress protein [Thermoplasmatota archaeon]
MVAFDGSRTSRYAAEWAREIAAIDGAKVTLTGVDPRARASAHPGDSVEALARERAVELSLGRLRRAHVSVERLTLTGDPAREILRAERASHADLCLVGSRGRGSLASLTLGSTSDAIKDGARASVLIAKSPPPAGRIVAPTDGSLHARASVRVAASLGAAWDVPVDVLAVREEPEHRSQVRTPETAARDVRAGYTLRSATAYGDAASGILAHAKKTHAGLIVMGHRGLGAFVDLALGSVSARVAHESPTAVLFVKSRDR